MRKSKQAAAREFGSRARKEIIKRDHGECIFCRMRYKPGEAGNFAVGIKEIMHYVPRSQGGLGIPENGAVGCRWHHEMLDNGSQGNREEMLGIFREYLEGIYPGWDKKKLTYDKWGFLEGGGVQ